VWTHAYEPLNIPGSYHPAIFREVGENIHWNAKKNHICITSFEGLQLEDVNANT
jgi:hypothetical protein